MLIHPWDGASSDTEWRDWLAGHDFGQLAVSDPGNGAPHVIPTHFAVDGDTLLIHLARPNKVWAAIQARPVVVMSVVDDYAYVPTTWRAKAGGPDEDGVPTSYYSAVQLTCHAETVDDPQRKAELFTCRARGIHRAPLDHHPVRLPPLPHLTLPPNGGNASLVATAVRLGRVRSPMPRQRWVLAGDVGSLEMAHDRLAVKEPGDVPGEPPAGVAGRKRLGVVLQPFPGDAQEIGRRSLGVPEQLDRAAAFRPGQDGPALGEGSLELAFLAREDLQVGVFGNHVRSRFRLTDPATLDRSASGAETDRDQSGRIANPGRRRDLAGEFAMGLVARASRATFRVRDAGCFTPIIRVVTMV
jgi:transcriptional regulator